MKIENGYLNIGPAGPSSTQVRPNPGQANPLRGLSGTEKPIFGRQPLRLNELTIDKVLTEKEKQTLLVLFNGDSAGIFKTYGHSRVQNMKSGLLLDVKG